MTRQQDNIQPSKPRSKYTPHDKLFKEFFHRFLAEFMTLFFPDKAARLDFSDINFSQQEQIINLPDQALRITDIVAEVGLKDSTVEALKTSHMDSRVKRKKRNVEGIQEGSARNDSERDETKETEFIIVHVDVESNRPTSIPHRMFVYYSLLRALKNRPVLPIALLTRGGSATPESGTIGLQTYTEELWGEELV